MPDRSRAAGFLLALGFFWPSAAALAQSGACQMGAKVTDRQNRSGTVIEAKGADCRVRLEDGSVRYYLAWMLGPGGGAAPASGTAATLTPGTYACTAAGGLAGTLRLIIKDGSRYADRGGTTGSYTFETKTGAIVFTSGAWAGNYGRLLGPRKIGISSRPGGFSSTVCDLH
jgi:hypothetical protein